MDIIERNIVCKWQCEIAEISKWNTRFDATEEKSSELGDTYSVVAKRQKSKSIIKINTTNLKK